MTRGRAEPPEVRFWQFVTKDEATGCWLWTGSLNDAGYGKLGAGNGRKGWVRAHRFAYEHYIGPIPAGLHLDHLCRIRSCVNPEHLEPVTSRENSLRSPICQTAINAAKTHCKQGHSFERHGYVSSNGSRRCRACRSNYLNEYRYARRRAEGRCIRGPRRYTPIPADPDAPAKTCPNREHSTHPDAA